MQTQQYVPFPRLPRHIVDQAEGRAGLEPAVWETQNFSYPNQLDPTCCATSVRRGERVKIHLNLFIFEFVNAFVAIRRENVESLGKKPFYLFEFFAALFFVKILTISLNCLSRVRNARQINQFGISGANC